MFRGYYIAANGMINQQRIIDTISNNVSNVNTAGFKGDKNVSDTFARQLILIHGKKNKTGTIEYRTFEKTQTDLSQGSFEFTERRLDMAIKGDAFFNVAPYNTDNGDVLLTRNGQFNIDDEGYLCLVDSGRVLSTDGPIQIGSADFAVSNDGVITTDDGRTFTLKLSTVGNGDVDKIGENMFTSDDVQDAAGGFEIIQGAYERSNVDIGKAATEALEAQRVFDACSKALTAIDGINQKAATQLGSVN